MGGRHPRFSRAPQRPPVRARERRRPRRGGLAGRRAALADGRRRPRDRADRHRRRGPDGLRHGARSLAQPGARRALAPRGRAAAARRHRTAAPQRHPRAAAQHPVPAAGAGRVKRHARRPDRAPARLAVPARHLGALPARARRVDRDARGAQPLAAPGPVGGGGASLLPGGRRARRGAHGHPHGRGADSARRALERGSGASRRRGGSRWSRRPARRTPPRGSDARLPIRSPRQPRRTGGCRVADRPRRQHHDPLGRPGVRMDPGLHAARSSRGRRARASPSRWSP